MKRLSTKQRAAIVSALVEGVGVRSTCRMTGASKGSVLKLIADLGPVCEQYQDAALVSLPCSTLECDEIWNFVGRRRPQGPNKPRLDSWTFTAVCGDTRLIPTWLVGQRDPQTANQFMADLASRMCGRVQITTDGHMMYLDATERAFGGNADYAMLIKEYGRPIDDERRYAPAQCTGTKRVRIQGMPDTDRISTSYVERSNLSIRMGLRRFTRLTNGHSKKWENHCAALAIYFMNYNFARPHATVRCSPAMAAGVTDTLWKIADIVRLLEAVEDGADPMDLALADRNHRPVT